MSDSLMLFCMYNYIIMCNVFLHFVPELNLESRFCKVSVTNLVVRISVEIQQNLIEKYDSPRGRFTIETKQNLMCSI